MAKHHLKSKPVYKAGHARTIGKSHYQIGKSIKVKDKIFKAMKAGKRISKTGRVYYEHRANMSDKNPANRI
jgi:hypothetical protein